MSKTVDIFEEAKERFFDSLDELQKQAIEDLGILGERAAAEKLLTKWMTDSVSDMAFRYAIAAEAHDSYFGEVEPDLSDESIQAAFGTLEYADDIRNLVCAAHDHQYLHVRDIHLLFEVLCFLGGHPNRVLDFTDNYASYCYLHYELSYQLEDKEVYNKNLKLDKPIEFTMNEDYVNAPLFSSYITIQD